MLKIKPVAVHTEQQFPIMTKAKLSFYPITVHAHINDVVPRSKSCMEVCLA